MISAHFKYIKEIVEHPKNREGKIVTFRKYIAWNLGRRLLNEASYSIELVPGTSVVLSNRENYATLAYTCGLYDFEDMLFMMHMLRPGDHFGDFGSNIGVYSVLAGSRGASVLAVEPVPDTYRRLCENLRMNATSATPVNCGLSDQEGNLKFTTDRGGMNKVAKNDGQNTCDVDVMTVDGLVKQTGHAPIVVKIDVEGFEFPLLTGAKELLSTHLNAIIIELNGSGHEYGHSDEAVHSLIISHGFAPYRYHPFSRELIKRDGINHGSFNTIYIKESALDSVRERVRQAVPVALRSGPV